MINFKDRLHFTLDSNEDLVITIKNSASVITIPNEDVLDLAVDLMSTTGLLYTDEEWDDYDSDQLECYIREEKEDLILAAGRIQILRQEVERRKIELQDKELNNKILKIGNAALKYTNRPPVKSIDELKDVLPTHESFELIKALAKAAVDD